MAKVWSHFFVMLWVLFIISSGIYLFSRGFLLSRRIRTDFNECIKLKACDTAESEVSECFCCFVTFSFNLTNYFHFIDFFFLRYNLQEPNCLNRRKVEEIFTDVNSSSDYCLPKKTRIILIVIDALKYEFGLFDKSKFKTNNPFDVS